MMRVLGPTALLLVGLLPSPATAQEGERCRFLCAPELKVEPTFTVPNLFSPPRIRTLDTGDEERASREVEFEIILAVDIPTSLPRLGFTVEAIWTPFSGTSTNPFTGATADRLGIEEIRDNPVELEFETNFKLLTAEQTGGWVESHVDVVDKFSPAERPRDRSAYTHKLNFELDTAVLLFNWLPAGNWLRTLEVEASLDYVATGLPRAGDELSGERFLDDASPWGLSFVVVIPIAPL